MIEEDTEAARERERFLKGYFLMKGLQMTECQEMSEV